MKAISVPLPEGRFALGPTAALLDTPWYVASIAALAGTSAAIMYVSMGAPALKSIAAVIAVLPEKSVVAADAPLQEATVVARSIVLLEKSVAAAGAVLRTRHAVMEHAGLPVLMEGAAPLEKFVVAMFAALPGASAVVMEDVAPPHTLTVVAVANVGDLDVDDTAARAGFV